MEMHLIILLFAAGVVAVVAAGLVMLAGRIRNLYMHRQFIAVDPFNRYIQPPHFKVGYPDERSGPRVLFFGDSRASQWPVPPMGNGFQFVNRGIGGQTTAQIVGRFDGHVVPLRPDCVILQLGVNDLKTIALAPELESQIVGTCLENILELVGRCESEGYRVILTTIFPLGRTPLLRKYYLPPNFHHTIDDINARLRTLSSPRLTVMDAYDILSDESGVVKKEYHADLVHINGAGYRALNEELVRLLDDLHRRS